MVFNDNVATLIHDLKTPIIAQERALDLLLKDAFGKLNNSQTEIITEIKESCEYLYSLVYAAMNDYRNSDSQIKLKYENINFKKLLTSIINEVNSLAVDKGQNFSVKCNVDYIFADEFQIKRVIVNLISNAVKYAYKNSEIEIVSKQIENNFVFIVRNFAPKIENLDKVFEKFESTSNSGLGLYLVDNVVKLHGGNVIAKNDEENKYSFGFVIPNI